jgi:transposase
LRDLTASLFEQLQQRDNQLTEHKAKLGRQVEELKRQELKIELLTHEMAILKRWQYARRSEQMDAVQYSLLDESIDADLAEDRRRSRTVAIVRGKNQCGRSPPKGSQHGRWRSRPQ